MNWRHASMSGNLTWVRSTELGPLPHQTLYSELSPTLIMGFAARGGAPADYIKFSTVLCVTSEDPNVIKLQQENLCWVSLTVANSEEYKRWLAAINLALAGSKEYLAMNLDLTPLAKHHESLPASTATNCAYELLLHRSRKLSFHDKNAINSVREGHNRTLSRVFLRKKSEAGGAAVHLDNGTTFTHFADGNFVQPQSKSSKLILKLKSKERRKKLVRATLCEGDATLCLPGGSGIESTKICKPSGPKVLSDDVNSVSIAERQCESTLLDDIVMTQQKLSSSLENSASQLSGSGAPRGRLQTTPEKLRESRKLFSYTPSDDSFSTGKGDSRLAVDFFLDTLPFAAAERELSVFLSQNVDGSSLPGFLPLDNDNRSVRDKEGNCETRINASTVASISAKRQVVAPMYNELSLSEDTEFCSSLRDTEPHAPCLKNFSSKLNKDIGDDWAHDRATTKRKRLIGGECEVINEPQSFQTSGQFLEMPTGFLETEGKEREFIYYKQNKTLNEKKANNYSDICNNRGADAKRRIFAKSIIDQIISFSPGSTARDDSSPIVFLPALDTPPRRLLSRDRDGFYCPIEASVAAIRRHSASCVSSFTGGS